MKPRLANVLLARFQHSSGCNPPERERATGLEGSKPSNVRPSRYERVLAPLELPTSRGHTRQRMGLQQFEASWRRQMKIQQTTCPAFCLPQPRSCFQFLRVSRAPLVLNPITNCMLSGRWACKMSLFHPYRGSASEDDVSVGSTLLLHLLATGSTTQEEWFPPYLAGG